MESEIWTEKYRSKNLDEFVTDERDLIQRMLSNPSQLNHLLFVSKTPGTGKTTLGKMIIRAYGADNLIINSSDERKLEVVRDKVNGFARNMSSKPGVPKIILMDEADGLLAATQDALRNVMETYHSNCRFILTANNQSKIIDAIQSRCTIINFRTPPKEQVVRRLRFIIEAEKVDCSDVEAVVAKLIEMYYPSIRDMIKNLQKAHLVGKVTPASFKSLSAIDQEVYSLIISGKTLDARKKWIELGLVPEELVRNFFEIFIASPPSNLEVFQKAVLLFAETEKEFGLSCDREITLCGFAVRFSQIMKTGAALK